MRKDLFLGILAGLLAGALWGIVFVVPKILTAYSAADIAFGRYVVFGFISATLLVPHAGRIRKTTTWPIVLSALGLSCLSFSVYYFVLAASIKFSGVAPVSLIIGLLPITIPVFSKDKVVNPKLFGFSLTAILAGLIVLNLPLIQDALVTQVPLENQIIGICLAIVALGLWTAFALLNGKFLKRHPEINSSIWSSLLGVSAFLTSLPLWFLFNIPNETKDLTRFLNPAYGLCMIVIGLGSSWIATYLWNIASRRIPAAVAGQLIVSETLFALLYNYIYNWQIPNVSEFCAALLLISGVVFGIRSFRQS